MARKAFQTQLASARPSDIMKAKFTLDLTDQPINEQPNEHEKSKNYKKTQGNKKPGDNKKPADHKKLDDERKPDYNMMPPSPTQEMVASSLLNRTSGEVFFAASHETSFWSG